MNAGYAVIEQGKLHVNTVSETRRAAAVNWLCVSKNVMIHAEMTDEQIEKTWQFFSRNETIATISPVHIEAAAPPPDPDQREARD